MIKLNKYVVRIINLKQALSHSLFLKKIHRLIKFNQNSWLKQCIDINTDLIKESKNVFEKVFYFYKLINNALFGKSLENMRKHKDIKHVTTERRRNYLVSEPNYHTKKFSTENLLVIEMKKNRYLWINLSF